MFHFTYVNILVFTLIFFPCQADTVAEFEVWTRTLTSEIKRLSTNGSSSSSNKESNGAEAAAAAAAAEEEEEEVSSVASSSVNSSNRNSKGESRKTSSFPAPEYSVFFSK